MLCEKTPIEGAFVVSFDKMEDSRGWFSRVYCAEAFRGCGFSLNIAQANMSANLFAGTLRGLHYQAAPWGEDKLVRVTRGRAFDCAADIRKGSPTYGRWHATELSAHNMRAFFIPKGCAHGYYTTEDDTELMYFVSSPYHPESERGIAWNDPVLGVRWPGEPKIISPKDAQWPPFDWGL
jgi:dTDP-4-dehydrorhamnose 3,5-epimerase